MGNCILVVWGKSRYDVLIRAAQEIAEGFRQYSDLKVQEIDITTTEGLKILHEMVNTPEIRPELVFCMQAVLFDVKTGAGAIIPNLREYPFWGAIFDHPLCHESRIENLNHNNMYISYINASDIEFTDRYHSIQRQYHYFLPHGGFIGNNTQTAFLDRIPAVFFSGSYIEEKIVEQKLAELPPNTQAIAKNWIQSMQEADLPVKAYHLCLAKALDQFEKSMDLIIDPEKEKEIFAALFEIVDDAVRSRSRRNAISSLLEAGIPVAVVGENWDKFSGKNKALLTILSESGGLSIDEVIRLMSNFQLVLNISDTFGQGSHERIPTTMLNGSICITNPSTYLLEKYENRKDILFYDPKDLKTLPEQVKWVWENQEEAKAIAQRGYEKAIATDTWQHRAKEILEVLKIRKTEQYKNI